MVLFSTHSTTTTDHHSIVNLDLLSVFFVFVVANLIYFLSKWPKSTVLEVSFFLEKKNVFACVDQTHKCLTRNSIVVFSIFTVSRTERAGLCLSVARIERNLRKGQYAKRINKGSSVYLAAVLEYISAEVLEVAGNACKQNKKLRITPRHIMLAIEHDPELKELLKDVTISGGGVMPNINAVLLPKSSVRAPTLLSQEM